MQKEKIRVDNLLCLVCGCCVGVCPTGAMTLTAEKLVIDDRVCVRCDRCVDVCPAGALKKQAES